MNLARIGSPNFSATDLLATKTAAAPSVTWDELPAVVVPFFLKAGFNFCNPSNEVSFLTPSSRVTRTSLTFPSASLTLARTGTISSANNPNCCACAALRCDSTANLSCVSLFIPYFSATF